jgi:hypothetical protein
MVKEDIFVDDFEIPDVLFRCDVFGGKTTMSACEHLCSNYWSCNKITEANDLLVKEGY